MDSVGPYFILFQMYILLWLYLKRKYMPLKALIEGRICQYTNSFTMMKAGIRCAVLRNRIFCMSVQDGLSGGVVFTSSHLNVSGQICQLYFVDLVSRDPMSQSSFQLHWPSAQVRSTLRSRFVCAQNKHRRCRSVAESSGAQAMCRITRQRPIPEATGIWAKLYQCRPNLALIGR